MLRFCNSKKSEVTMTAIEEYKRMQHGDGDMTGGECCTGAHAVTENPSTRAQITFGGLHWLHLARPL